MSSVDVVKLREGAERATALMAADIATDPVTAAVIVSDLAHGVLALLRDRADVIERLQLMAAAERETADGARGRAIGLETAAEVVAGGSPV
jgi:hypothetical protein